MTSNETPLQAFARVHNITKRQASRVLRGLRTLEWAQNGAKEANRRRLAAISDMTR